MGVIYGIVLCSSSSRYVPLQNLGCCMGTSLKQSMSLKVLINYNAWLFGIVKNERKRKGVKNESETSKESGT